MIDQPTEAQRFDPDGRYVRRWLPVLARLPAQWIHQPWLAPEHVLNDAGGQAAWVGVVGGGAGAASDVPLNFTRAASRSELPSSEASCPPRNLYISSTNPPIPASPAQVWSWASTTPGQSWRLRSRRQPSRRQTQWCRRACAAAARRGRAARRRRSRRAPSAPQPMPSRQRRSGCSWRTTGGRTVDRWITGCQGCVWGPAAAALPRLPWRRAGKVNDTFFPRPSADLRCPSPSNADHGLPAPPLAGTL